MKRILRRRQGITLVELLVAMVVLGIMLTSVAGATFQSARRTMSVAGSGYRQGVLMEEVNRLGALPYSALPSGTSCRTITAGLQTFNSCVTASAFGLYGMQLRVVVRPAQPGVAPDTVTFVRAAAPTINPLSM